MRQDYQKFLELDAEVIAIAPDTMGNTKSYFQNNQLPFPGLADNLLEVYQQYDVQSKLASLGQRPGLFIIDKQGITRFTYLGTQQWQIPPNQLVLEQLQRLKSNSVQ